ncbi:MAG TPA: VRR-NUC domain-containing protein [Actinomycetota bacterium]
MSEPHYAELDMFEADLKAAVIKIAKRERWLVHHTANRQGSRNSAKGSGVPDLIMAHPGGRLILAELKKQKAKLEPLQEQWQFALERCPGIEYYVWRPSDLPDIDRILGGTQ